MLLLSLSKIKKYYGQRCVLDVESLRIYSGEKIGIVGANGAGKTTLFEIIAGRLEADSGSVDLYGSYSYIEQLNDMEENSGLSGGEMTKLKINEAFSHQSHLLLADEPASNLDIDNIEFLQRRLIHFQGAALIISHDRMLLNTVCNKIIEVAEGRIKIYSGNYDDYTEQKQVQKQREIFEYEQYRKEKQRLAEAANRIKSRAIKMKDRPSGMSELEAKKLSMRTAVSSKRGQLEKDAKAMESRISQLEVKERPRETPRAKIDIQEGSRLYSKIAVKGENINKSFGDRVILDDVSFTIANGEKVALIGANGAGKTTLLRMIINGENIEKPEALKIAYFAQGLEVLDMNDTIYNNVALQSSLSQLQIRNILSRLLFKRDDVFKKVSVLSGGEKVKVALARIFSKDANMLILDEPTNYLDIYSIESLQDLATDYNGTILVSSHDRAFINGFATKTLKLHKSKLTVHTNSI